MPIERVIQDSDDEEHDIGELTTSIDLLQDTSPQNKASDLLECVSEADNGPDGPLLPLPKSDPHLGVNFDDFLQSQGQGAQVFPSQQQREGLWILDGGSGSVGG
jgi:hypothetical protein